MGDGDYTVVIIVRSNLYANQIRARARENCFIQRSVLLWVRVSFRINRS